MDHKLANRRIAWFSCGAASAVAASISAPDVRVYCDTGSEDADNRRFMADCALKFKWPPITILRSNEYKDTWDVWQRRKYLAAIELVRFNLQRFGIFFN